MTREVVSTARATSEELQLVSFSIGEEEFGVDILKVQEINRMPAVTHVPDTEEHVKGVINLRGKVIPILDLRKMFGFAPREHDKNTRIVVLELSGTTVGMVVDAVREVLRIPARVLEAPPAAVAGSGSGFITSIAKLDDRMLILLDPERLQMLN